MINNSRSLDMFVKDVGNLSPLAREQEDELSKIIMEGGEEGEEAARKLTMHNIRFVLKLSHYYKSMKVPREDMVQDGIIGMLDAARKYDYRLQSNRFISYAKLYVLQRMQRGIAEVSQPVSLPVNAMASYGAIGRAIGSLDTHGISPDAEMVADKVGVSKCRAARSMVIAAGHVPLDVPLRPGPGNHVTRKDNIPDDTFPLPGDMVAVDMEGCTERILSVLTPRERGAICLRFGLCGKMEHSQRGIAKIIGVTHERVRQMLARALDKVLYYNKVSDIEEAGLLVGVSKEKISVLHAEAKYRIMNGLYSARTTGRASRDREREADDE